MPETAIVIFDCQWNIITKACESDLCCKVPSLWISHYFCAVFGLDSLDLIWINTLGKNGRHL